MASSVRGKLVGAVVAAGALAVMLPAAAQNPAVTVRVDANRNRRAINPNIYGTAFASRAALADLNCPLNRSGGNAASRYNWQLNASNRAADWYFESIGEASAIPGEHGDTFISESKAAGAQAMLTLPMLDWVAKLGPNRAKLCSFSRAKYGAQQDADWQWFPDAGNGVRTNGTEIAGNNPTDAHVPSDSLFQQGWVQHLVGRWGTAARGGLRYYLMDNEPSIWFSSHRDVHPVGPTMEEIRDRLLDYAARVKAVDPGALVVGPEEWGWSGYILSGYDQQWGAQHGWNNLPDRAAHGGMDYLPWLLQQIHQHDAAAGKRLLDVFSVHYYPQGGEFWGGTDTATQLRRNHSTRSLWDPNYVDESWINEKVQLVPRLRSWVNTYYPGTKIGITEYNWGAEGHINGAIAQADVLGIFGREGLDLANRWTTPDPSTPTYKAMKLYRNYDGRRSGFGDTSVQASVPNPDTLSAFAALRSGDGALTVVALNKALSGNTLATLSLGNFPGAGRAQVWQLTSANIIWRLADASYAGASLNATLPPQSITLFVLPPRRLNCGGVAYTGPSGAFGTDAYFTGGVTRAYPPRPIDGTTDDLLYLTARAGGSFGYSIPVNNGAYTVKLRFAECQYTAASQRKLNVTLNGRSVLAGFDPFAAAGAANRAIVKSFPVTVTAGRVNLAFASALAGREAAVAGIDLAPAL